MLQRKAGYGLAPPVETARRRRESKITIHQRNAAVRRRRRVTAKRSPAERVPCANGAIRIAVREHRPKIGFICERDHSLREWLRRGEIRFDQISRDTAPEPRPSQGWRARGWWPGRGSSASKGRTAVWDRARRNRRCAARAGPPSRI